MPRARDTKVWNEDLARACEARYEMAVRAGDRRQFMWREGSQTIRGVRKDIYTFSSGRIVNMPEKGLTKTVRALLEAVIRGQTEILPDGYAEAIAQGEKPAGNPFENHPYLKNIAARSGAYAILMAFHHSPIKNLSKDEICRRAQPYCDSDMKENFHAGRLHGAWAGHKTLVKHGFISLVAGGPRHIEGVGFRTQAHIYTLTRDGEQFIELLLQKFPQGAANATAQTAAAANSGHAFGGADLGGVAFGGARSPFRSPGHTCRARPASTKATRTNELAQGDEEKLLAWIIAGAQVGDTMDFKVGKARRKQLHDACDALQRELPGLRLDHSSAFETDTSNRRVLTITILQRPMESGATASAKCRLYNGSFSGAHSDADVRAAKRPRTKPPPALAAAEAALKRQAEHEALKKSESKQSSMNRIDVDEDDEEMKLAIALSESVASSKLSLTSKIEDVNMKPDDELARAIKLSQETAEKAPRKLEESEKKPAARDTDGFNDDEIALAIKLSQQKPARDSQDLEEMEHRAIQESAEMARQSTVLRESDLYSSDSDNELFSGPTFGGQGQATNIKASVASKKRNATARRSLFQPEPSSETIDLLSDSDDEGEVPSKPAEKRQAKRAAPRPRPPPPQKEVIDIDDDSENDEEVIEILDASQDSVVPAAVGTLSANSVGSALRHQQLTILIDNRERNRNVTPRHLRMELTRLVTDGDLKSVWPLHMPLGSVEEKSLVLGDFAFDIECDSAPGRKRISVAVERKRVADLVQRSASGDHWHQFMKMRDNCTKSIFLIETDTRTATRFTAFGAQELEEWNPGCTLIDDERSIFLFFARALLSSHSANFIQTMDEISSLRAVAALGLMATASEEFRRKAAKAAPPVRNSATRLVDRLTAGGVPWKLARQLGDCLGSIQYLEELYQECASDACRSLLLVPFITETEFDGQEKTAADWSNKIFRIFQTSFDTDFASSASVETTETRLVTIEVSESNHKLFQQPTEKSFYTLKIRDKNPLDLSLPTFVMRTTAGNLSSHRVFVHLLQAKAMIPLITSRIEDCGGDFLAITKEVACVINSQCHHRTIVAGKDRRVLLLCGLSPALSASRKKAGYRPETRVLVDLVLAELMLTHDLVVLQAVRLKGDTELILQLLSLACYHYHLLFQQECGRR